MLGKQSTIFFVYYTLTDQFFGLLPQRDSVLLATKLSPAIVKTAQDKEKTVKNS